MLELLELSTYIVVGVEFFVCMAAKARTDEMILYGLCLGFDDADLWRRSNCWRWTRDRVGGAAEDELKTDVFNSNDDV